ncbi:MAG TPA: LytTR family DNA-binding domain-containing protein [Thermoanaerobaculia bacterium]|nr:LytTR family DNA-binding domain-containing protein [Thermoanaerobaculia bacterium]
MAELVPEPRPLLRAMIVDDEPLCRRRIRELVGGRDDVVIAAECRDGNDARHALAAVQPDILFLDVEMPGGSGLELLENIDWRRRPAVIFVTAHSSYAVQAFSARAVDYLVKPFKAERFEQSLERAREFVLMNRTRLQYGVGPALFPRWPPRITIRTAGGVTFLKSDDVSWMEAAGNYVRVHAGKQTHMIRETMNRLESGLDPTRFARIHRSTIVNIDRIVQAIPAFGRSFVLVLKDGSRLKLTAPYRRNLERLGFSF